MDIRRELVGTKVEIKGKEGTIVDETKNTFTIKFPDTTKRIMKKGNKFSFIINNKKQTIEGHKIVMRPEDRIKLKWK